MKKSSWVNTSLFISVFVLTFILFNWFSKSIYFSGFDSWIKTNLILYVICLFSKNHRYTLAPDFRWNFYLSVNSLFGLAIGIYGRYGGEYCWWDDRILVRKKIWVSLFK